MARPKKQDHERRSARNEQRYTVAEFEWLNEQAAKAGITMTEFVRRRALSLPVRPAPSAQGVDPALVTELNRIGVNLNQVAKALNAGRALPSSAIALQQDLQAALRKVLGHGA